jgi:hypothetical protein
MGAARLYDLMVAEEASQVTTRVDRSIAAGLVERHRAQLESWRSYAPLLDGWRMSDFWEAVERDGRPVDTGTKIFFESLVRIMHGSRSLADDDVSRGLIKQREFNLKGGLAKLSSLRALQQFNGSVGADRPSPPARWSIVKDIVTDIHIGLTRDPLDGLNA